MRILCVALLATSAVGCLAERVRADYGRGEAEILSAAGADGRREEAGGERREPLPSDQPVDLDGLVGEAVTRNPEILQVRAKVRAALARVRAASRLPDLEFKLEMWN